MGVGHTAFDTWPVTALDKPLLWIIPPVFKDSHIRIGVISNVDFVGVAESVSITLSNQQTDILRRFTELVEVFVYGIPSPTKPFPFMYAIINQKAEICWDDIKQALTPDLHEPLRGRSIPTPPFIVTHIGSSRSYQVKCVLEESPFGFIVPVNQFGSSSQAAGQESLSNLYHSKYGITLQPRQPILICSMGTPIRADPPVDTPSLATSKSKKPNVRSQVYLVPQVVKLHPLTKHIQSLARIPRLLFQLEAGVIAKKVAADLFLSEDNKFREYSEFFTRENPSYFFKSTALYLTAVALTRPSAAIAVDYETLEWLGDAVFRFALALMGLHDESIRLNFFALMSNGNVGRMTEKSYPSLCNSYVLSKPPSLKTPEQCRERLQNLNILADVAEALMAVSFFAGGIKSVLHTIRKLGSAEVHEQLSGSIAVGPHDLEAYKKSAIKPAVIRLEASLQLIKKSDRATMDVGELDESRQLLIAALSKRGVESLELYKQYCLGNY